MAKRLVTVDNLHNIDFNKEARGRSSWTAYDAGGGGCTADVFYAIADLAPSFGMVLRQGKGFITVSAACTVLIRTQADYDQTAIFPIVGIETDAFDNFIYRFLPVAGTYNFDAEEYPFPENSGFQVFVASKTTTKPMVCVVQDYLILTNDQNYLAKKVWLGVGDSIVDWAAMGANPSSSPANKVYTYDYHWMNKCKDFLNTPKYLGGGGQSVRVINKGYANTTSESGKYQLKTNHYIDNIPFDVLSIGFGMNDAETSRNVTTTMYKANLIEYIKFRNEKRPDAEVIIMSPTPTDSSTRTSTIAAYRTAAQQVALDSTYGTTARGVYYVDLGNAFPMIAANFRDTETTGNRVHPSGIGQGLMWNLISTVVENMNIFKVL